MQMPWLSEETGPWPGYIIGGFDCVECKKMDYFSGAPITSMDWLKSQHGLVNYIHYEMWDEITYVFPNFSLGMDK